MTSPSRRARACLIVALCATPLAVADVVYYSDWTGVPGPDQSRIVRSTVDGESMEVLVEGAFGLVLELDTQQGKMYWVEDHNRIRRANLNGSDVELLVAGLNGYGRDLEIDLEAGKLYWLDSQHIARANLDGSGIEVVVDTPNLTQAIALHVPSQKVYWIENTVDGMPRIRRANLIDGSNVETVLALDEWVSLKALEIAAEFPEPRMYWTQFAYPGPNSYMASAALDGSDYQLYDADVHINIGNVAITSSALYWTAGGCDETGACQGSIYKGGPRGGQVELFETALPGGIAVDPTASAVPATSIPAHAALVVSLLLASTLWARTRLTRSRPRRSPGTRRM